MLKKKNFWGKKGGTLPYFKNKTIVPEASHLTILHQAGLRKTAVRFTELPHPFFRGRWRPAFITDTRVLLPTVSWSSFDVDIVSLMDSGSKIAVIP